MPYSYQLLYNHCFFDINWLRLLRPMVLVPQQTTNVVASAAYSPIASAHESIGWDRLG